MTKLRDTRLTQREDREPFSIYLRSTLVAKLADYEDIGSVDELRELKEKATAKKPRPLDENGKYNKCPNCGGWAEDSAENRYKYCPKCGQALDWEV